MKLATWNVNSIRAREGRVRAWLEQAQPDIVCLQEIKVEAAGFPLGLFRDLGYQVELVGQKSYNGVAIAAKGALTDVEVGLGDGVDDSEARFLAATVDGVRVVSLYVPNGQAIGSDKYAYKLAWLARLRAWLDRHGDPALELALCGDWNVAPADLDVHDPAAWAGHIHCSEPERAAVAAVTAWGLRDGFRAVNPEARAYSWWDYRGVAFFKDHGLRIDYLLLSAPLAARLIACTIDREARKGRDASDHAPVMATFR
ncbi:MAG TPA: exodeoxyribonuclease III [Kofleriaceae bacterium]|nr:exodeoxyribonuclease III [Kofleriaceae bacterium]